MVVVRFVHRETGKHGNQCWNDYDLCRAISEMDMHRCYYGVTDGVWIVPGTFDALYNN